MHFIVKFSDYQLKRDNFEFFFFYMHSGIDLKKVDKCIGDPEADVENPVLKAEQESQVFLLVTNWLLHVFSRSYRF